ncbi:MAG: hypothetical protein HW416_1779 [Chloroflexi bacterium]|nr:hypothetical protein [Chloroflexota bacterium]
MADMWRRLPLASRIGPLIAATGLITGITAVLVVAWQLQVVAFAQLERAQIAIADSAAAIADEHLNAAQALVSSVASRPTVRAAAERADWDSPDIVAALQFLRQEVPSFINVGLLDGAGRSRANVLNPATNGLSFADREYFVEALRTGRASVTNPFLSANPVAPTFAVGAPIYGRDGAIHAVLVVGFDLGRLATEMRSPGASEGGRLVLVSPSGVTAVHSDPQKALAPISDEGPWATDAHRRGAISTGIETMPRGDGDRLIAYAPLRQAGWGVLISTPTAAIYGPVNLATSRAAAIAVPLALMLGVAGGWTAIRLLQPLRALSRATARVAQGNLSVRVRPEGASDLRTLAEEFNRMTEALEKKDDEQLRQRADLLEREVQERIEAAINLEAANKELEAFSYTVSHDLRAPLRAMDGFSRILEEDHGSELSVEARRYLGLVRSNALQMGALVDDLLAFSKLARQGLAKESTDPGRIARGVLADLMQHEDGRQIDVSIRELPSCLADPSLLRQVFSNLLGNALKYTRRRERAEIEVGSRVVDGEVAYFVTDNGTGFDMQYAGKLFGVFQRLHRSEEFEGTGVGLAIVQRIIHRHEGRVWAEAAIDKGATFSFTLGGNNGRG